MPHEKNKIRVKRKGKGHGAVTTDGEDEKIGETAATLIWIKRPASDPGPGDHFAFDPTEPLTGLPDPPFKVKAKGKDRVTVAYAGWSGSTSWDYTIKVIDLSAESDSEWVRSDGSATIKNK